VRSRAALVLIAFALGAGGLADAQRVPSGPVPSVAPPLLLRLEGVIEPSAEAARGKGFTITSLGFLGGDERRWLAVTKARTVGGDQPLDGKDVLALVDPFTPNFLVTGSRALLDRLLEAAPDTPVRIEGLVDRGSRTYQLRTVEREPGASGG
jgi:hypothetical protein